ncbi:hypothetical protein F1544_12280 [Kineosporiaceae bacterium B12]|nr:hypothetical protein [Kineococcus rubinsiae]
MTAVGDGSITVENPEGSTTISLPDDVVVTRDAGPGTEPASAAVSDLAVGEHVHVTQTDPAATTDRVAASAVIMPTPPVPGTGTPSAPPQGAPAPADAPAAPSGAPTDAPTDAPAATS